MPKSKLRDLAAFNADRAQYFHKANDPGPRPNGIACPLCGTELLDSRPMVTLTSYPPKKNIHCQSCDYRGYRFA